MRTTLTVDDKLAEILRKRAFESGKSFKQVVNDALRAGIEVEGAGPKRRRYRIKPVSLGGVLPGINLDKSLRIAEELEDMEQALRLHLRK